MECEDSDSSSICDDLEAMEIDKPLNVTSAKKTKKKKPTTRPEKLPPKLKLLLRKANLHYTKGDNKNAVKFCKTIIGEYKLSPDPYMLLGRIYEHENPTKSLKYQMIAADLNPSDISNWLRLATFAENNENYDKAIQCLDNLLFIDPNNDDAQLKRDNLIEKNRKNDKLITIKGNILKVMPQDRPETQISTVMGMLENYIKENEGNLDEKYLEFFFSKLNILMKRKLYKDCFEVFKKFFNIEVSIIDEKQSNSKRKFQVVAYNFPDSVPTEVQIMFFVVLIHIQCFDLIKSQVDALINTKENIEKYGKLWLEVVDAFIEVKDYDNANQLLNVFKNCQILDPMLMLRQGECFDAMKNYEQANEMYVAILEKHPTYSQAYSSLIVNLCLFDRQDEIIAAMHKYKEAAAIAAKMWVK